VGQALALEVDDGSISVSAVGSIAGAALFRAARGDSARGRDLGRRVERAPLAVPLRDASTSARFRSPRSRRQGSSPRASGATSGAWSTSSQVWRRARTYYVVNMGLISLVVAIEGHERWGAVFKERFAWLATTYLVYGFIGGVIWVGYQTANYWALAVFALPLLLMRKTQEAYLRHTQRSAQKLRQGGRDDPDARTSRSSTRTSSARTLDGRHGEPLGHRRRAGRLHGRPFAPRPAARAGDRP
jgi:hypothetical protein